MIGVSCRNENNGDPMVQKKKEKIDELCKKQLEACLTIPKNLIKGKEEGKESERSRPG